MPEATITGAEKRCMTPMAAGQTPSKAPGTTDSSSTGTVKTPRAKTEPVTNIRRHGATAWKREAPAGFAAGGHMEKQQYCKLQKV